MRRREETESGCPGGDRHPRSRRAATGRAPDSVFSVTPTARKRNRTIREGWRVAAGRDHFFPDTACRKVFQRGSVTRRSHQRTEVQDEERDLTGEGRLLMLLEIATTAAPRSGRDDGAPYGLRELSARAPPRSSRGRSLVRSPRRGRVCRVPTPGGRLFEGGPARSRSLLSGPGR